MCLFVSEFRIERTNIPNFGQILIYILRTLIMPTSINQEQETWVVDMGNFKSINVFVQRPRKWLAL